MSTYNDANFIEEAINSVKKQSFRNWELIIINDASTDNTDSIVRNYASKDGRFRYIRNSQNRGCPVNLHKGVKLSRGKFIARLDSDDYWIGARKLAKQLAFLESNPDHAMVGTEAYAVDEQSKILYPINNPQKDADIRKVFLYEPCFLHSSIMARKNVILNEGNYNASLFLIEDYDLWMRIGIHHKLANLPERLTAYRIRPASLTRIHYKKWASDALNLINKYRKYYPNYSKSVLIWNLRLLYATHLNIVSVNKIKNYFKNVK